MSDARRPWLTRLRGARLTALVAGVTAFAVVAGSLAAWVIVRELSRTDGTLAALAAAGEAGAWHSIEPDEIVSLTSVDPSAPLVVDGADAALSSSWLFQLTAVGGAAPAELSIGAGPIATVPAGATVSVPVLVRLDGDGSFELAASSPVTVTLTAFAWFTPVEGETDVDGEPDAGEPTPSPTPAVTSDPSPESGPGPEATATPTINSAPIVEAPDVAQPTRPAPGGSVAIAPRQLLDTRTGLGGELFDGSRVTFSPRGLGAVPSDGVAAVWLQVTLSGPDATLDLATSTSTAPGAPVLAAGAAGSASGLVLAALDESGYVTLIPSAGTTAITATVVGWVAAAERDVDASVIDSGLVAGSASVDWSRADDRVNASSPGAAPEGAIALWSVQSAGSGTLGSSPSDGRVTSVPVAGAATGIVADVDGFGVDGDVEVGEVAFLGFVAGEAGDGAPEITIETPVADGEVDLAAGGGIIEISGTVNAGSAGVRRVDVRVGERFVGVADLILDGDVLRWRLLTSAPPGEAEIRAIAVDWADGEATDSVAFDVIAPDAAAVVVAAGTVVLDRDERADLVIADPSSLVFATASPARVGDIIVSEPSEAAPAGLLRIVESIEVRDATVVLGTREASLDAVFTQVTIAKYAIPASDESPLQASGGATQGGIAPTSLGISGTIASFELLGVINLTQQLDADFRPISTDVKVSVTSKANERVVNTVEGESSEKGAGTPAEGADMRIQAKLTVSKKFTLRYNFVLDIQPKFEWLRLPTVDVRHFEASVTMEVADTLSMEVSGRASYDSTKDRNFPKFAEIPLGGPVTFVVAGVPIVLRFAISPKLALSASIEIKSVFGYKASEELTLGFRYKDGVFAPIAEHSKSRGPTPPATYVNADGKLQLGIGLTVKAYEALSVTVGLAPGLALSASFAVVTGDVPSTTGRITLRATLDIYLEVGLRLFGIDLLTWEKSAEVYSKDVWNTELGYGADGTTESDADDPGSGTTIATGNGDRPLVIIIDVSASMSGAGIDDARASLTEVVVNQPPGGSLGVWTYPGNASSGCDPGGFKIPVQSFTATGEVLDLIDGLNTGGNTPTGEALLAAGEQLRADGMTGATILLVTDGEANCAQEPCEAARQLVADGFDVTVHTVLVALQGAGRDELGCVSTETGGTTIDIDDTAALADVIDDFSRAQIEVELQVPALARIGDAATVGVVIRNTGARDVTGVQFQVDAAGGEVPGIVGPSVLSAMGNIPTGAEVRRNITVVPSPGERVDAGTLQLDVTAWGENTDVVVTSGTVEVSDVEVITAGPLLNERAADIVVVGDGFAVAPDWGVGGELSPDCEPVDGGGEGTAASVVLACPGAASIDVLDRAQPMTPGGGAASGTQASAAGEHPFGSVIISAGAEDVGLTALLQRCAVEECLLSDPDMQTAILTAQILDLTDLYERASTLFGDDDAATVIVTAYPWLFPQVGSGACTEYSAEEVVLFNYLVGFLNSANEASALRAAANGFPVEFATTTADALRPDRTLCDEAPGVTITADGGMLTESGAGAAADSVITWSQGFAPDESAGAAPETPAAEANPLQPLFTPDVTLQLDATRGPDSPLGAVALQPAQTVHVVGSGYQPGSLVVVSLTRESHTVIATGAVDEEGGIAMRGVVPLHLSSGEATLTVLSVTDAGDAVEVRAPIAITSPTPLWVSLLALGSVLLLLVGAALLVTGILRRRTPRGAFSTNVPLV